MTTKEFQERSALQIFLSYFKPHKKLFLMDLGCALLISVIDLAFPYVSRGCMYELLPQSAYRTFFAAMGAVGIAFAVRAVQMAICANWLASGMGVTATSPITSTPLSPHSGA